VIAAPIGSHLLIESRGDVLGIFSPQNGTGPYQGQLFTSLDYLQIDYTANSWLTIVAGKFLTPFGIYNERLTPIWIHNAPLILSIGTQTPGSSLGGMARGAFNVRDNFEINYVAYYSASDRTQYWAAGRTAGGRVGFFIPSRRLEAGFSYQRFLQDQRLNSYGAHFSWQPYSVPLDIKSEYAQSPSGKGYWAEAAYRLSRGRGPDSLVGRLQPVFRMQQFDRSKQIPGDSLPSENTRQADFGFDYFLPRSVRINANYSRQFSSQGNSNIWDIGITYRFMFPAWPGGSK